MPTEIINKNTSVLNKVPALSQLTKGEGVVVHRTNDNGGAVDVVDTCLGIFLRVGRLEDDHVSDKVVRIGPALVTTSDTIPSQVGIDNAVAAQDWTGQLWWRADTKEFLINTDGSPTGWESVIPVREQATTSTEGVVSLATLSDIYKGESEIKVVTAAGLRQYLDGVDAGTVYLVYVDPGNPNSSDAKSNRGNVPDRPFKSPQRAFLEVARRSFVRNAPGNPTPNDRTERMAVYMAPAVYELYNGRGGDVDISSYGRYRDAANLILLNREYLADEALAAIPLVSRTETCRRDLYYYIDGLSNDIAARGNLRTINNAKFIRNPNGSYIAAYDSPTERSESRQALAALEVAAKLVIKNLGPITDDSLIVDPAPNPCLDVQTSISTLIDILDSTLDSTVSGVNPHDPNQVPPNPGTVSASFPNEGEPTFQNLQGFNNNVKGGIILPRGVSVIGPDLRKVVFRPTYVPNADGSEGKSAIFRMTGGNFFQGFTVKDRIGQDESAHNLACFNFCTQSDLQNYYDKVALVFDDPTYYHQQQDAANLIQGNILWIDKKVRESALYTNATGEEKGDFDRYSLDVISAIVRDLKAAGNINILRVANTIFSQFSQLATNDTIRVSAEAFWSDAFVAIAEYCKLALRNNALTSEGGFVDFAIIADSENFSNPCINVQNTVDNFADIMTAVVLDELPPDLDIDRFGISDVEANPAENEIVGPVSQNSVPNTVDGASPYIFSASLRSVWGMSGIDGDGNDVTGFKSYVAAQFTIVSLQTDASAFVGTGPGTGEVASKRYRGTLAVDTSDYRNFGYAVRNEAYAQLVSCFCIGPAIHYHATGGAEFSITNSTSNFGDVSLQAEGFVGDGGNEGAYIQDQDYKWLKIIRPRLIDRSNPRKPSIGTYASRTSNTLTLQSDIDFEDITPFTIRTGSRVYLTYTSVEVIQGAPTVVENVLNATVASPGVTANSINKLVIPISSFNGTWPSDSLLEGLTVYIQRIVDARSPEDQIFKIQVQAPIISRGRPVENFIFRFKYNALSGAPTYQKQLPYEQGKVAFIGSSVTEDANDRLYNLTLLSAFSDAEGNADNNLEFYPTIDLDYDPIYQGGSILDSPPSSLTYIILNSVLTELGYDSTARNNILIASATDYVFPVGPSDLRPDVEFNKPSIIRCGSHTWEYLGYYNYDTALPVAQSSIIGAGLSAGDAATLKVSKLQKEKKAGRIYATGLNEEGDFFIGPTRIDTRTGQSTDTRLADSESPDLQTFRRVNIVQSLTLLPNSVQRMQAGSSLKFESGSGLDISPDPETKDVGVKAFYAIQSGVENRRYGVARPATTFEAQNEVSTDNRSNFISPANLAEWRAAKQLVSLRTASIPIYIGNWPGAAAVGYSASYNSTYWPEPQAPIVALSQNPGLEFRPFVNLASAASWANANLQPTETAVLYFSPGYYSISATFRCNVVIKGVGNTDSLTLDTGNYTNTTTNSVLFYQSLRLVNEIVDTGVDRGKQYPVGIGLSGTLTIMGTGTSSISNVAFVSPIQAYSALRGTAALSGRAPIEDLLFRALNLQYNSFLDNALYYLLGNLSFGLPDRWFRVFYDSEVIPFIRKVGGQLDVERVVFEPRAPYSSESNNSTFNQDGHIRLESGADLNINGVAIRGNEVFVIPKTMTSSISGVVYQIANTPKGTVGDNFSGASVPLHTPPTYITWINHCYECLVTGLPSTTTTGYVALFGHAPSFINIFSGDSTVNLRNPNFIRNNSLFRNYNDDRNNMRLECNYKGTYSLNATTRQSASLGVRGTVDLSDSGSGPLDLYNEIMGIGATKRGPLMSSFIVMAKREVKLNLGQSYNGQNNGLAGWVGAFGYIPTLTQQILTGLSFKCTGLVLLRNNSSMVATACNLTRNNNDFWAEAGSSNNQNIDLSTRAATARNVFWRTYSPGFYTGPSLTTTPTSGVNMKRQIAAATNDDPLTITNASTSAFFALNTNTLPVTTFTYTGVNSVI
jgi:hypothetical protein